MLFLFLVLSSPANLVFAQEFTPVSLENGPDSTTLYVLVGDSANIPKDVIGVELVITADFSEMPPQEISLDLDPGWFCPGNMGAGHTWTVSADSSSATLTIWDLDSAVCTGHGMFLELHRTSGIGQMDIANIGKVAAPIEATLLHRNSSQMLVYPNPAPPGTSINILGAEPDHVIDVFDLQGKLLQQFEGNGNQVVLQSLGPGMYILRMRSRKTGLVTDRKSVVVK